MNVLVTGTRAPASMDIIRSLIHQGHRVFGADSLHFPLGRFVKGLANHFTLPKPNNNLDLFIKELENILKAHSIDLLIPTCEEIFFLSQGYERLAKHCRVFFEPFSRLKDLHNKFKFNQLVDEYGLNAPKSWLLNTEQDKAQIPPNLDIILKPVYSRFGSHLIIKPSQEKIDALTLEVPYIAQEFITGKEYSSYAIADKGKVLIHSSYHSKYTSGPAAGIYFEPVEIQEISDFIEIFCNQYQFSGQIAFDFIFNKSKAYALECNPRVTSGFHLISEQINWPSLLQGQVQTYSLSSKPYMLGLAMKLYGFGYFCRDPNLFMKDYFRAHDVLKNRAYPWFGVKSLLTLANISARMIKERKNFHCASTDDIEYNG
ncbi:MAG: ATP-grasp domain-containing protein [Legionella longbeachae]|nr:ATP-grasp domain-containing protein [Legionella longbeachae]